MLLNHIQQLHVLFRRGRVATADHFKKMGVLVLELRLRELLRCLRLFKKLRVDLRLIT